MNEKSFDFTETLKDLDAGIYTQKISAAIKKVALGVVEHSKAGEITLTFKMKRIGESHQVTVKHSLAYKSPTLRGESRETDETGTVLHVGRAGAVSIMPESQTDMFKAPDKTTA